MEKSILCNQIVFNYKFINPLKYIVAITLCFFGFQLFFSANPSFFLSLIQVVCVVMACCTFLITWNSRRFLNNKSLLFIGIVSLYIGTVDLLHIFTGDNSYFFYNAGINLSTQLILVSKLIQTVSWSLAPWFFKHKLKYPLFFFVFTAFIVLVFSAIFITSSFPDCMVKGQPTLFAVSWEIITGLLLIFAVILLIGFRKRYDPAVWWLVFFSYIFAFTANILISPLIPAGLLTFGFYFKFVSLFLIYKSIIERDLVRPYRNLKRKEKALAREKERLVVTLRSIGEGVIVTDTKERIILINRMAEELSGWKQEEAIGQPFQKIFYFINNRTNNLIDCPVKKVLKLGNIVSETKQTILIAKDGKEKYISHTGAPILDDKGKLIGVVVVFRDLTAQKKLEEELLRTQKLESLAVLAGGIAHDFNNILAGILANAQLAKVLLQKGKDIKKYLESLEDDIERASALTHQLLTFSKGGAPVKKTSLIAEIIKESVDFALRGSDVRCEFLLPDNLWLVEIDEGQINQVINNLVINADQAMPDGGMIIVKAENVMVTPGNHFALGGEKYVKISIIDQGIGIPEEHLGTIFDPYFTTKANGHGLGLATSYSIIKKHDGYMDVESKLGEGTTFSIYLPATQNMIEEENKEQNEQLLIGEGKILLMDDATFINRTGQILRLIGFDVDLARDGEEVISLYNKALKSGDPYDVVLMDLTIPGGMGGGETIKKLLKIHPQVKAIVSSGYSNDPMIIDYQKYGFSGYISKPYKIEELARTLNELIIKQDDSINFLGDISALKVSEN